MRTQLLVIVLAVAASLATLVSDAWAAQVPLGPEFQVNTYTTSRQALPDVAADAAGNFVVAWQSYDQDGSQDGIFAQRFSASGAPMGSEFQANVYTTATEGTPSVGADANGNFLVVWTGLDANFQGIGGRQFDAAGVPVGPEFPVNEIATAAQNAPRVAMNGTGDFVVVWSSIDGDFAGVFARRFDATGTPQAGDFRVNTYTTGNQLSPSLAIDAAGNFVVAWYGGAAQDGDSFGVFAQRYDAAGVPQGSEFQVNTYTTNGQALPSVAMSPSGSFVIVWASDFSQDGSGTGIFAQRYDAAGVPQGGEFRVNAYTTGDQMDPRASMDTDGSFVVVWAEPAHAGGIKTFARRFDASGTPSGGDVALNQFTGGSQRRPVVAVQPDQRFVAAWTSSNQDGDNDGVFARLFGDDLIFRDGFESGDLSKWSSATVDGGDLSASASAAMRSTSVGLRGLVDDTASLFVQDENPVDEDRYHARFYLDTNGFDPGETGGAHRTRTFIVFEEAPTRRLAAIVLKRQGGAYSIEGRCRLDSGAQADTGFFPIIDGPHAVEIDWKRSSSAIANDGTFELRIDGVSQTLLTGLANSHSSVDFVRLGALNVKATATGTLFWDEFESRRASVIGN